MRGSPVVVVVRLLVRLLVRRGPVVGSEEQRLQGGVHGVSVPHLVGRNVETGGQGRSGASIRVQFQLRDDELRV